MKNKEFSTYATNKGGYIKSPKNEAKGDPKATVTKNGGKDLRAGRG